MSRDKGFSTIGIFIVMVLFIFISVNVDIKEIFNSATWHSNIAFLKYLFWNFWNHIREPVTHYYFLWIKYFLTPFKEMVLSHNYMDMMSERGNIDLFK